MAYVVNDAALGQAGTTTHYAVEYTDGRGRRRRTRQRSLGSAYSFLRTLRLGSEPVVRMVVVRKVKRR